MKNSGISEETQSRELNRGTGVGVTDLSKSVSESLFERLTKSDGKLSKFSGSGGDVNVAPVAPVALERVIVKKDRRVKEGDQVVIKDCSIKKLAENNTAEYVRLEKEREEAKARAKNYENCIIS